MHARGIEGEKLRTVSFCCQFAFFDNIKFVTNNYKNFPAIQFSENVVDRFYYFSKDDQTYFIPTSPLLDYCAMSLISNYYIPAHKNP